MLEAMALGTPVVATAVGGIPEVAGDAAVLVPVGDDDALAQALAGVVGDEAQWAPLIAAGSVRAATFSWERTATGMVDLWRRLAAGGSDAREWQPSSPGLLRPTARPGSVGRGYLRDAHQRSRGSPPCARPWPRRPRRRPWRRLAAPSNA